jgi:hypothetical protein
VEARGYSNPDSHVSPCRGGFDLFQEQDAKIGEPYENEPATTLQWAIDLKLKKVPEPGKYLYRVDCFDRTGKEEKLLASNSVFITFVKAEKEPGPQANRSRPSKKQRVLRTRRFEARLVNAPAEGAATPEPH